MSSSFHSRLTKRPKGSPWSWKGAKQFQQCQLPGEYHRHCSQLLDSGSAHGKFRKSLTVSCELFCLFLASHPHLKSEPHFSGCWGCIRGYIWTCRVCGYLWIAKASHVANLNQVSCPALISSQLVQGLFAGYNLISSSFRKKRQTAKRCSAGATMYSVPRCSRSWRALSMLHQTLSAASLSVSIFVINMIWSYVIICPSFSTSLWSLIMFDKLSLAILLGLLKGSQSW